MTMKPLDETKKALQKAHNNAKNIEPRAFTKEEIREKLLSHFRGIVEYWAKEVPDDKTVEERISGAVFSVLSALDGSSVNLPAFKIIPDPHHTDKDYHIDKGENYYPDDVNIGGVLHELYHD